jgi:hypothetical protein
MYHDVLCWNKINFLTNTVKFLMIDKVTIMFILIIRIQNKNGIRRSNLLLISPVFEITMNWFECCTCVLIELNYWLINCIIELLMIFMLSCWWYCVFTFEYSVLSECINTQHTHIYKHTHTYMRIHRCNTHYVWGHTYTDVMISNNCVKNTTTKVVQKQCEKKM